MDTFNLKAHPFIQGLGVRVVDSHIQFDSTETHLPSLVNCRLHQPSPYAEMPGGRNQRNAQRPDVGPRFTANRQNVAPAHYSTILLRNELAMAVPQNASVKGNALIQRRRLGECQVALLARHNIQRLAMAGEMRFLELENF